FRGERGGVTFVDDYAHLPTEVRAALTTARDGSWRRVVCVFQPHRYSRTQALWADFAHAFVDADVLVVTELYPAGEAPRPGVSGRLVADAVRAAHPEAAVEWRADRAELVDFLRQELRPGFPGLAITLGEFFAQIHPGDARVGAGGAVSLPVLARQTAALGLRGLEWGVGVPGSVGGAVRMNAGGHGSDVAAALTRAWLFD